MVKKCTYFVHVSLYLPNNKTVYDYIYDLLQKICMQKKGRCQHLKLLVV